MPIRRQVLLCMILPSLQICGCMGPTVTLNGSLNRDLTQMVSTNWCPSAADKWLRTVAANVVLGLDIGRRVRVYAGGAHIALRFTSDPNWKYEQDFFTPVLGISLEHHWSGEGLFARVSAVWTGDPEHDQGFTGSMHDMDLGRERLRLVLGRPFASVTAYAGLQSKKVWLQQIPHPMFPDNFLFGERKNLEGVLGVEGRVETSTVFIDAAFGNGFELEMGIRWSL